MLEWTYLIPVIAFAVWVISNVQQRKREAAKQVGGAAPRPTGQRPRSTSSEIDKFLEEINRRRQQQQQRPEMATTQPSPPVRRQQPQRQQERPRPVESRRPRRAREAPPPDILIAEAVVPEVLAATSIEERAMAIASAPTVTGRAKIPIHLARLRELLASPEGRRTAFLMKEVFGPPKAKQPRVRG